MANQAKPNLGEARRGLTFKREAVNVDERRVELAFSSEIPYRRAFGMEVLGHDAKEVDLSRIADGTHPLLWNHNRDIPIGVVESARIDDDKVGRAVVRFSKNPKAQEIFDDVVDGTLRQVSVAYEVKKWNKMEREEGDDEWRATSWQPYEISIVSLAADPSVGVGKQKDKIMDNNAPDKDNQRNKDNTPPVDPVKIQEAATTAERARVAEISNIARQHGFQDEGQKAIDDGVPAAKFSSQILGLIAERERKAKEDSSKTDNKRTREGGDPKAISSGVEILSNDKNIRSIGQHFVRSDAIQKSGYKIGERIHARVTIPELSSFGQRATVGIGSSFQNIGASNYIDVPGFVVPERRQLRVAQIFPSGPISKGSLRFIRESSYTNAATRVAEGAEKPAATPALEEVTFNVEKTAVVLKVTDEMFADFEATSGYIDNYLTHSVMQLEDEQLLTGTGSSMIYGVHGITGINSIAAGSYQSVGDALNGAIEQVRVYGNTEPNWFVMHPTDFHNLTRTKDANGQYYGGGFFGGAYGQGQYSNVQVIWGIPTLVTSSQTQGQALCGNFQIGAQIFRRTGLTVESTNSNEDDFLKNLVALRAEQRMLLATWKPKAFCEVTGIA